MDASNPIRIFVGVDPRQPVAYHVLCDSIMWRTSQAVSITPLLLHTLPITRRGMTEFTYSRFLVPWLCRYEGIGIFMDADMIVRGDIAELASLADDSFSVQMMQEQPKFEWTSLMLFNNAKCKNLTPEFIDDTRNSMFDLAWAQGIGSLPPEFNHCIGYCESNDHAKVYHHTAGIPVWPETKGNHCEDKLWLEQFRHANSTVPWDQLMARSVHAPATLKKMQLRQMGVENAH